MSNSAGNSTAKECSRNSVVKIEKVSDLKGEPKNNQCHVYYTHRDGTTYCSPNRDFDAKVKIDAVEVDGSPLCGDISPTADHEVRNIATTEITIGSPQNSPRKERQEIEQCADDRLILV
jgi:hypothetical protein